MHEFRAHELLDYSDIWPYFVLKIQMIIVHTSANSTWYAILWYFDGFYMQKLVEELHVQYIFWICQFIFLFWSLCIGFITDDLFKFSVHKVTVFMPFVFTWIGQNEYIVLGIQQFVFVCSNVFGIQYWVFIDDNGLRYSKPPKLVVFQNFVRFLQFFDTIGGTTFKPWYDSESSLSKLSNGLDHVNVVPPIMSILGVQSRSVFFVTRLILWPVAQ